MIAADKWLALLPEFGEIRDPELRNLSLEAMALAAREGGWTEETVELCPVSLRYAGCCSLLRHIRAVTRTCMADLEVLGDFYENNGCPLDRDLVVSGALLHDIGKFIEFTLVDGVPAHSPRAELLRHPLSGAIVAARAGLPDTLVNLIATHSFEGKDSARTREADFVRSVDEFVFNCSVAGLKKIAD